MARRPAEPDFVGYTPDGIRTRAATLKGWRPRPLVDGGRSAQNSRVGSSPLAYYRKPIAADAGSAGVGRSGRPQEVTRRSRHVRRSRTYFVGLSQLEIRRV